MSDSKPPSDDPEVQRAQGRNIVVRLALAAWGFFKALVGVAGKGK